MDARIYFMKKLLSIIAACAFLTPLYADEMMSMKEYLILNADDNSDHVAIYTSKRCSATFLVVAKIFGESTTENKRVHDLMVAKGSDLMTAAAAIEANLNNRDVFQVLGEVKDQIKIMVDKLMKISDESYANTGVYLTPHQEDLAICRTLFD